MSKHTTDLQLCHQSLHSVEKDTCLRMCDILRIEQSFQLGEQSIKLFGFDDRPRDYRKLARVEARYEVELLLDLNDLLELQAKPANKFIIKRVAD